MATKEEKIQAREAAKEQKKILRAKKIARRRGLKNFGWWFFGFLSSFLIVGGAAAIAVAVIPVGTYVNSNSEYVDENTQKKTLLDIIMNYQEYSLSNFPVISKALQSALESAGLDKYISIDYDKLADVKVKDFDPEYIYKNCIEVVATIDSVGLAGYLGDFANLKIMTEWTPVGADVTVDPNAEGFEAYMYYYKNSNDQYVRAFNDDKTMVSGAENQQLYYPALRKIPVDELVNCIPTRIGQAEVVDLLSVFTTLEDGSLLKKLFNGYTVKDMGSFDANGILLNDVLEHSDDNDSLYKILCAAVNVAEGEEQPTWQTITIGNLNSIDINKVKLVDVIAPTKDNEDMFNILREATGAKTNEELTIGSLSSIDKDNIKLTVLFAYEGNESLYKVLGAKTEEEAKEMTVSSLSDFDINAVKLNDVTELSDDLVDILVHGIDDTEKTKETITIGDLNTFQMDRVPLSLVIKDNEENKKLTTILTEATNATSYSDLTISSLSGSSFNINNVKLSTVIEETPENASLFNVLVDATGVEKGNITIGDLSGFSIDNIKLKTIFGDESTGNVVLDTLLKEDDITIATLPEKINNLSLYDAYGEQCFTQDSTNTWIVADHYEKKTVTVENSDGTVTQKYSYVYDSTGTAPYYVSKDSGFMLLLCYKAENIDETNGRAKLYYPSTYTYKDFEGGSSEDNNNINKVVANATIYELIASGIVADSEGGYSNIIKKMTVQDLINFAAKYSALIS